jgi:butyrate kinase
MNYRVLAINPGSTSTKIAVFDDVTPVFVKTLRHDAAKIAEFEGIIDQYEFRKELVLEVMKENNIEPKSLDAVVGRGGLVKPLKSGGTYIVNDIMLEDLKDPTRWGRIHASNLGAFIAKSIADDLGLTAYIVDPVPVDEFPEIARISGVPEIERKSLFHALNIRYIARLLARELGKYFVDCNMIGVHLGGGISVVAIEKSKAIDVNNGLLGMGPFSPQRAGGLPIGDLLDMAYSGEYTKKELVGKLAAKSGLLAYLGTDDGLEIEKRIQNGDQKAELIMSAMCYQIGKEIGACAAALKGNVDAIFITGGLAYDKFIVNYVTAMTKFIAPVHVIPGEREMEALTQGAVRVLKGMETGKNYV